MTIRNTWRVDCSTYRNIPSTAGWTFLPHRGVDWTLRPPVHPVPTIDYADVVVDHSRRVVVDRRPNPNIDPKLIVELTAETKDIIIQCGCGQRISLVTLLGLEAVKPIFDGISDRIRGLIDGLEDKKSEGG